MLRRANGYGSEQLAAIDAFLRCESFVIGPLREQGTAIDTDDEACGAYQFGGEHGNIAGTTAQVLHAHACIDMSLALI